MEFCPAFPSIALLFGVLINYLVPAKVFVWVTSIATFAAMDLDRYTTVANEIPEKPERDRTRSAGFPHAFLSLQFVARISFPGARHRIDGLFPGYPGGFARRPTVASTADSAFLRVQTQYHSHPDFHFRRAFNSSRFI